MKGQAVYKLITIDVTDSPPKPLGERRYAQLPRAGEWVEMADEGGAGVVFEVVKVVHSDEGYGCDLYVRRVGPTLERIDALCSRGGATASSG